MNRWRFFSISLALVVGTVALVPIQLIAFDGAEDEYLWISKYLFADTSNVSEEPATRNHATDGFDGAEAEYKDISKNCGNGNGCEADVPLPRVTKSYNSPAKSASGQIPI
ncbi:MAG: hypothetical protein ACFFB3_05775 [Candidatus Hodarchaeota archaeon]